MESFAVLLVAAVLFLGFLFLCVCHVYKPPNAYINARRGYLNVCVKNWANPGKWVHQRAKYESLSSGIPETFQDNKHCIL